MSDAHLAAAGTEPYVWHNTVDLPHSAELLDAALAWLRAQQVDTIVLLGDLTEGADAESFAVVRDRAGKLGKPVLAAPGNCDVDPGDRSISAFQGIAGPGLTVAPAVLPMEAGCAIDLIGVAAEPESKRLRGSLIAERPDAFELLRIVFTHYPILDLEGDLADSGFRHSGNLTNRAEIEFNLRKSGTPSLIIHGHLHIHDARISGSLLHLSCAALIEPPHHVSTIEVALKAERIVVERRAHAVRTDDVERLPVFAPDHGRWAWTEHSWRTLPE